VTDCLRRPPRRAGRETWHQGVARGVCPRHRWVVGAGRALPPEAAGQDLIVLELPDRFWQFVKSGQGR